MDVRSRSRLLILKRSGRSAIVGLCINMTFQSGLLCVLGGNSVINFVPDDFAIAVEVLGSQ